jgi:Xaa-Pro aminopeptidase
MTDIINIRINKLRELLDTEKIDAFFILSEENRRYFSGFKGEDSSFDEHAGALFITRKKAMLITDGRYEIFAKKEAPLYEIKLFKKSVFHGLVDIIKSEKIKSIGFESIRISYINYRLILDLLNKNNLSDVKLIISDIFFADLRIIKSKTEIEYLKKSLKIAETAFLNFIKDIKLDSITEKEAAWEMEKKMRELGAENLSFPVIAASGENAAAPHATPLDKIIKKGEPVIFDFGAKLNGYCSDITRTFSLGALDDKFEKIFNIVLNAQEKAINAAKPGMKAHDLDAVAREYIEKKGYKSEFSHSLGHGIGLCVHESPRISFKSDTILKPGMVFTIEPGIYIKGWGGVRLENMIVITKTGADVLNEINCADFINI